MKVLHRIWKFAKDHPTAVVTWVVLLGGWELAAHFWAPESTIKNSPIIPSWEFVFTDSLKALSGGWSFDYWAPNPSRGGDETYWGAVLALGYHALNTMWRLLLGLSIGIVAGVGTGLFLSYIPWMRQMAWTPLNLMRMFPLLAAIPLFQFWLGANLRGTTTFIAFGVWVLLVVATINAIRNVPDRYVESARTLGASRWRTYRSIIAPAAIPELRTGVLLSVGLSWSLTVGAEYIGMPNGLGNILSVAEFTTNTGRMIIIAVVIALCALTSFFVLNSLFDRMVSWVPSAAQARVPQAAGAAALGGPLGV